jgi:two-component system, OmpR family, response regulator
LKVLLIEDDEDTAAYVANGLTEQAHTVDRAQNGRDGMFLAGDGGYEVLIVDRMLPGMDGLDLVKLLRSAKVLTPVLFLSALGGLDDRVTGLDGGGDDYLVKPFAFSELVARLNALARRAPLWRPIRCCGSAISSWTCWGGASHGGAS